MPALGYNLLTYRAKALDLLGSRGGLTSSYFHDDPLFITEINEAFRSLQDRYEFLKDSDKTLDLVAGTQQYTLPSGVMGSKVIDIVIDAKTSGDPPIHLKARTEDWLRRNFPLDVTDADEQGTPVFYAFTDNDKRDFIMRPIPDWSGTNNIRVVSTLLSEYLGRWFWDAGTTTIAVDPDSSPTQVTFSGTIDTTLVKAGDELGVAKQALMDTQTTDQYLTPRRWYEIQSVDSATVVTLTEAYVEAQETAGAVAVAQVPTIEAQHRQKLGFIPAFMAALEMAGADDPKYASIQAKAAAALRSLKLDRYQTPKMRMGAGKHPYFVN